MTYSATICLSCSVWSVAISFLQSHTLKKKKLRRKLGTIDNFHNYATIQRCPKTIFLSFCCLLSLSVRLGTCDYFSNPYAAHCHWVEGSKREAGHLVVSKFLENFAWPQTWRQKKSPQKTGVHPVMTSFKLWSPTKICQTWIKCELSLTHCR